MTSARLSLLITGNYYFMTAGSNNNNNINGDNNDVDEEGEETLLGVLDLDCLAVAGFDEEDKIGLERIVEHIVGACDW